MSDLVLIRHGETIGNSSVRLYGMTDVPLSEHGRAQMLRAAGAIADLAFARVYASPLGRSLESARIVLGARRLEPTIVPEFREINFGRWEGLTYPEVAAHDPENYRLHLSAGADWSFPGGDSIRAFRQRVGGAAGRLLRALGSPTLAVLHKGVINAVINALLGLPLDGAVKRDIELGAIYRLRRAAGCWHIVTVNCVEHLGPTRIPGS